MLETLRIKNMAVVELAEIHFQQGLTIISGETGAGKSILVEAMSLLLGVRASADLVRSGCEEATVEGILDTTQLPQIAQRLEQLGFEKNQQVLIKRTVHRGGRHRVSINGELATVSMLQNLCEGLIDLCAQHEHQSLLKPKYQLELLDSYADLKNEVQAFEDTFLQWQKCLRAEKNFEEEHSQEKIDFLSFQIQEIESAQIQPEEDELLQKEKKRLQSTASRIDLAENAQTLLSSEEGTLTSLQACMARLRALQALDPHAKIFLESLERAKYELEETLSELRRYLTSTEPQPQALERLQERLSCIAQLKRKYGPTLEAITQTLEQCKKQWSKWQSSQEQRKILSQRRSELEAILHEQAKKLSKARAEASQKMEKAITQELQELNMPEAHFMLAISQEAHWQSSGADSIQFLIQTNRGDLPQPIGKIASGGELSRLLLAIRRVISDRGGMGVYIFDEIDTGMGGQTAFEVGKKLKSVSQYHQVICITHLPQIAAFATNHLVVKKSISEKRTSTEIFPLSEKLQHEELARMLSGPQLTAKNLATARELLELAQKAQ